MAVRINKRRLKAYPNAAQLEDQLNQMLAKVKLELDADLKNLIEKHPELVFEIYDRDPCMGTTKDIICAGLLEGIHQYKAPGCVARQPTGDRQWPNSMRSAKNIRRLWQKIGRA